MFNNKYNPDVLQTFEKEDKSRTKTKYELKNIPYKVITNENKVINNPDDFKIKIEDNKEDVKIKFNKILEDRKIKMLKVKKNEKFNKVNNLSLDSNYINDFKELRDDFESDFKEKEKDILKDRDKYNSMIESLLNDGLLG